MAIGSIWKKNRVRIVVAGDAGTGKSSLILDALSKSTLTNVPSVVPPSRLFHGYPDSLPNIIVDTPSGVEHADKRAEEFKRADCVMLTFASDRLDTFENLMSYWLPELRRLKVKVPVMIVGCKLDLWDCKLSARFWNIMALALKEFRQIEWWSRRSVYDISGSEKLDVFFYAQRSVLYPRSPIRDPHALTLMPQFLKALKRIFLLYDLDRDGALSDVELYNFEVNCFKSLALLPRIERLKSIVRDKLPKGVNARGITWEGFVCLHEYLMETQCSQSVWMILRKFGYNDEFRLVDNLLPPSFKRAPDQSVELTNGALDFLRGIFSMYDIDDAGAICRADVEDLFSTAPDCPWSEYPYMDAASIPAYGGLTLNGFLSEWVLMTLLEPAKTIEYLKYIMYDGDAASAIHLARKRCTYRKKTQSERNVFQCFVFGPKKAGKSALLDDFLGRPFSDASIPNTEERYAVNVVDGTEGNQKFLVLREIPESKVNDLLSDKESLAACDVALFVYDSTDESSFKNTAKLLAEVARHGKDTGYEVPSLIVSAKDDLDCYTKSIKDSTWLSEDMCIDAPVPISAKRGDFNDIFQKIITIAEHPHRRISETEARRSKEQYLRSVMADSVGAAGWHYRIGCFSCLFIIFGGDSEF